MTVSRRRTSSIISFAVTFFPSLPTSSTPTTFGYEMFSLPLAMASATSSPPAPIASMPIPPPVGVCESDPTSVCPGQPNRSKCTWWQMPLPGLLTNTPCLSATDWIYAWSSAFSKPDCSML